MKKILCFSIFLLILSAQSCKQAKTNKEAGLISPGPTSQTNGSAEADSSFIESVSNINTLSLPLTFYCGAETYTWASEYGDEIERRAPLYYGPAGVIGKLPINNNKIYIIYARIGDIIYPDLYIFDKQGNKLDSLYLHIGFCVGDEVGSSVNYTTINNDYSINMIDTTIYYQYIETGSNYHQILDSTIVSKRSYKLDTNGLYSIVDEQRIKVE